jgi:four helix bundle protein
MNTKGLESLHAWQSARRLAVTICKTILPRMPLEEKYNPTQQLRRAAQSVPANVAEAHGRFHQQDSIRFCSIARGSLDEVLSHLLVAHDLGYIPEDQIQELRVMWLDTARLLNGYIKYLGSIDHLEDRGGFRDSSGPECCATERLIPDP